MTMKIALTGGIATGKSTVQKILARMGIPVLDADALTHDLYNGDAELKQAIYSEFGPAVFDNNDVSQPVNRKALGNIVFGDAEKLALLEGWIHPKVKAAIEDFYHANADASLVVVTIPILYEKNRQHDFDAVWLVYATPQQQRARLMANRGLTEAEANARIASQLPIDEKRQWADVVIDNTFEEARLDESLPAIVARYEQLASL